MVRTQPRHERVQENDHGRDRLQPEGRDLVNRARAHRLQPRRWAVEGVSLLGLGRARPPEAVEAVLGGAWVALPQLGVVGHHSQECPVVHAWVFLILGSLFRLGTRKGYRSVAGPESNHVPPVRDAEQVGQTVPRDVLIGRQENALHVVDGQYPNVVGVQDAELLVEVRRAHRALRLPQVFVPHRHYRGRGRKGRRWHLQGVVGVV
mmetsp:Transcript_82050/g.183282  ORF Transcript_82050/g.183282 Transcript_82050/m.183282 type:complete len:206 (-) Transcript_82050:64-681(-)